jgi:hypothetical protein
MNTSIATCASLPLDGEGMRVGWATSAMPHKRSFI